MGFAQVFGNKIALLLRNLILLADDFDAPAATSSSWFQNVHVLKVIHFAIILKSFIILRKYVGQRTNFEVFAVLSSLLLDVSPEIGFGAESPGTSKVVELLVFIHTLKFGGPDQTSPKTIRSRLTTAPGD